MIICKCRKIEVDEVKEVIKQRDIKDLPTLLKFTAAGIGCRTCISKDHDPRGFRQIYLSDLIKK